MANIITWFDDKQVGGARGDVFEGCITINVVPVYQHSDKALIGRFELIIGQRYFSRDRYHDHKDPTFYYATVEQGIKGGEEVVRRMIKALSGRIG